MKSVHTDRYNRFLKFIIDARKRAGLTQQELADRLKKPQSYVSKYERGERRLDVIEFLEISRLLEIDSCDLLQEIDSPTPSQISGGDG